ncbi:hypothetical protein [Solirubrobacter soli]|uniref:hypothetical protein n=1 Tax=Solirubrobacter soli TaxID=363832 RepID=UPI00040DB7AD|nr:hypothetical protein [Solirubrobacter soli]
MRRSWLFAICAAGLLVPSSAHAGGGPVQPVQGGAGVSTPGASVNYVAVRAGRDTLVERVRRGDGTIERTRLIRGAYGVPGAAYDGSTTGLSADGSTLVLAAQRSGTRLLVLDTETLRVQRRLALPEFVAVDAMSPDGRVAYVLRYPKTRATYDVMALDLRTGKFRGGPIMDPREPDEKMSGFPLSRTMSPDGRWAYTLYSGEKNFVHALDTLKGEARCIDLPGGDFSGQALSVDGPILNVGRAEKIDLTTFALVKAPAATPTPTPRAAATPAPSRPDGGGIPWVPVLLGIAALAGVALLLSARRPEPLDVTLTHHVDKEKATL